jgi:hypothetical protein
MKGHRSRREGFEEVHLPPHPQVTRCGSGGCQHWLIPGSRITRYANCSSYHATSRMSNKGADYMVKECDQGCGQSAGLVGERTPPPARLRLNCREGEKQMAGDCALATHSLFLSSPFYRRRVQGRCMSHQRVALPNCSSPDTSPMPGAYHQHRHSHRHSATETPVSGLYHCRWSRQAKERLSRSSVPACGDIMPRLVIRSMHDFDSQKPTVALLA